MGRFDSAILHELGVYTRVIGYQPGIREHLISELERLPPRAIAVNYAESDATADGLGHGMYRLVRFAEQQGVLAVLILVCDWFTEYTEQDTLQYVCTILQQLNL
ncbi:MAG: hypothetical protein R2911_08645 [Caldilineaceae bacterium]